MTALEKNILDICRKAKEASRVLANIPTAKKNYALVRFCKDLIRHKKFILSENAKDLANAKNKSSAVLDRLRLNDARINDMIKSLNEVARLDDPVGKLIRRWKRPNGLWINKVRVPLGVIAIIYEARPNVTVDCAGLCLKSANAVILRGGTEAINSNLALHKILQQSLASCGLPAACINLVPFTDRKAVSQLLKQDEYIDVVIPRGGEGLINEVVKLSRIPVIKHYKGICHTYVDCDADLDMAFKICFNSKVQRPAVCNAMETLLVHKKIAANFLPEMVKRFKNAGVEIRGCPETRRIVKGIKKAAKEDWRTEYLDLILSVRVVKNLNEAIGHIDKYGSRHSDSIITANYRTGLEFLKRVDSACVYCNASTRFTDGYQFGMGAEIGISTDKLHARGPMALEELTTYKYMVFGSGQIRT